MKKSALIFIVFLTACQPTVLTTGEEMKIKAVLQKQQTAWNNGDIEAFMQGYWKSDSLMFVGKDITKGWNATLERYHKGYPDREAMGKLEFTFYEFRGIDENHYLVTGKYHLTRTNDGPSGMFTLLLKKIDGEWVIIYDHTS